MAILGYNTKGANGMADGAGRKLACKFTLASALTLTELHAWVQPSSSGTNSQSFVLHIHADSSGSPGARLAYTSTLGPYTGATVIEISQTGFNVALAAGDYWVGISFQVDVDASGFWDSGSALKGILAGAAFSPPSDPFGTPDYSPGARMLSVWAVVGAAPTTAFVPQIMVTG